MADQRTDIRNDEEDARERIEQERLRGIAAEEDVDVDVDELVDEQPDEEDEDGIF